MADKEMILTVVVRVNEDAEARIVAKFVSHAISEHFDEALNDYGVDVKDLQVLPVEVRGSL